MIFCLEYNKYYNALLNKQESYKSHYIITLDATCNGFQHITMLCKDAEMCHKLNLNNIKDNDKPND